MDDSHPDPVIPAPDGNGVPAPSYNAMDIDNGDHSVRGTTSDSDQSKEIQELKIQLQQSEQHQQIAVAQAVTDSEKRQQAAFAQTVAEAAADSEKRQKEVIDAAASKAVQPLTSQLEKLNKSFGGIAT